MFAEHKAASRFCIVSCPAARVSACLQSLKPTFSLADVALLGSPPSSAAANLAIYTIYKEQAFVPPEQILNTI